MISVKEARELVKFHTPKPRIQSCSLVEIRGKILAENIYATEQSPRFTNSAMDGVVVRFTENVLEYRIIGESAAGKPFLGIVNEGEAVRISTGAVVPDGANTVVPSEDYEVLESPLPSASPLVKGGLRGDAASEVICIKKTPKIGQWIRTAGSEYAQGSCVLKQGTELRPAHIALAAQLGLQTLPVFDAPRVALLATGSEILSVVQDPSQDPHPTLSQRERASEKLPLPLGEGRGEGLAVGKIYDANTPMLQAAVRDAGGEIVLTHHIEDTLEATILALSEALQTADIICTTGGVSVGEHDFVKQAAQTLGFETIFWRVRQKPGKPLFFAKRGNTLLFGLPGNPVSTLMCFLQYVQPVISSMLGREHSWKTLEAQMSTALVNKGGRAEFVRVRLDFSQKNQPPTAIPLAKQESFMLTSLTEADGFVFLDIDAEMYDGARVEVMLF